MPYFSCRGVRMWFVHWSTESLTSFSLFLKAISMYWWKKLGLSLPMVWSSSMFSTARFIIVQPSGVMTQSAKLKPPSIARSRRARLGSHRRLVM